MSAPNKPSPSETNRPKKRWFAYFGANSLAISILLHVLFGLGATYLVVEHFQKKHINFHATEPPSQHTEIEHKVELAKRNNVESAPPDIKRIVTTDVSAITLPEPPELPNDEASPSAMDGVDGVMGVGLGTGPGKGGPGGGGGIPLFGAEGGTGLAGFLYDLKQTSDRQPTHMTRPEFRKIAWHFIDANWNDSDLDSAYYKSKTQLNIARFAISTRASEEGPKAFGVQNEVQPGLWLAHYHGKVKAPVGGEYRFVGFGDDILAVRIDGNLVLDAGWVSLSVTRELHQALNFQWSGIYGTRESKGDELRGMGPTNGYLKRGSVFYMDGLTSVDMDVLIGDQGGAIAYYLFLEKVGDNYDTLPDGSPMLPFFQLVPGDPPEFPGGEEHPPFSTTTVPWEVDEH